MKKRESVLQEERLICPICHVLFATHDQDMVVFEHYSGDRVAVCYQHLVEIANRPGTYFPKLKPKMLPRFDLLDYLNQVKVAVSDKPLEEKKTQKTLETMIEFLDRTTLSKYVGGVAEFFSPEGLRETKKN